MRQARLRTGHNGSFGYGLQQQVILRTQDRVRSTVSTDRGYRSRSVHLDICILDHRFPFGDFGRNVAFQLIG